VRLRSLDGATALEFERPQPSARGLFRCDATLSIEGQIYAAQLQMIDAYRRFWLAYFDELARSEAAWIGAKCWSSEFGEVTLAARSEGDEVVMTASVESTDAMAGAAIGTLRLRRTDVARARDELAAFLRLA
jgi:hypothetical protein